jgi:hypothetical protein
MSTGDERKTTPGPAPARTMRTAWRNALGLGPVLAGAVFAIGCLANIGRPPWLLAIVLASVAAVGMAGASVLLSRSGAGALWGAAVSACAAGWDAYAALATPWSWIAVAGLVGPALVLILLWPALKAYELRTLEDEGPPATATSAPGARRWPRYLERIGHYGVTFAEETPTKCGYDVRLQLPASGRVTFKALAASVDKLEVAARVRRGSLRFEQLPGDRAHMVTLHVAERDFLAETIRMPIPTRARSVKDPIPVGVYEDGTVATITVREQAMLIVGLRGKGKSNLLNVLIAHLAMCVDVVIFCIDYKHRLARPWIQPWLDQQGYRPVIDWLATTPEETDLMLSACLRGIEARTSAGDGREKIEPSAGEPAVLVICDEMAVVFGQNLGNAYGEGPTNFQLARKAKKLTIVGRSEAIDPVFATQRGTVTMTADGDMKSQCDLRIGLGVASEADARLIIPDDLIAAADLARLTEPGSGILWRKNGRCAPFKVFRCDPEDIAEVYRRAHVLRPAPDQGLTEAFGEDYRDRWTHRAQYLLPGRSKLAASKPAAVIAALPGAGRDEFMRIVRSDLSDIDLPVGQLPGNDDGASAARTRYREFARRMGPTGFSVGAVVRLLESEKMPTDRQTAHQWVSEDRDAQLVEPMGKFGRWRWRQL